MEARYYDTNPLVRWAEAMAPGANDRCTAIGALLDSDLGRTQLLRAFSEITVAELHTTVMTHVRDDAASQYDMPWASTVMTSVFAWIEDGRVLVLPPDPKLVEKALALVAMGTRDYGIPLRAWDAAHIVQAAAWARSLGGPVEFVTGDAAIARFLMECHGYSSVLVPFDPEP